MSERKFSEVGTIGALKQLRVGRTAAAGGRKSGVYKHTISE